MCEDETREVVRNTVVQYLAVCAVLAACILIHRALVHLDWVMYGQYGYTTEDVYAFSPEATWGFWPHMTSRIWFLLGPAFALIALTPLLYCRRPRLSAFTVNVLLVSEAFLLFLIVVLHSSITRSCISICNGAA